MDAYIHWYKNKVSEDVTLKEDPSGNLANTAREIDSSSYLEPLAVDPDIVTCPARK